MQVCESKLDRLDLQMQRQQIICLQPLQKNMLQHAQRHQCGSTLTVWRDSVQCRIGKPGRDGAASVWLMCRTGLLRSEMHHWRGQRGKEHTPEKLGGMFLYFWLIAQDR